MKRCFAACRLSTAALVFSPFLARAHPGHDGGHELTWDYSGQAGSSLFGLPLLLVMAVAASATVVVLTTISARRKTTES